MISHPNPRFTIDEDSSGVISVTVVQWNGAERILIFPDSSDETVEVKGDVGDSVSVSGANGYRIVAEDKDGDRFVVQEYSTRNGEEENSFDVEQRSDMTVERAKQRYVEGETWILELENELEEAMT